MKYRKKPVVIDAVQFLNFGDHPAVWKSEDSPTGYAILTLENTKIKHEVTTTLAWGGFAEGKLDWIDADYGWGGVGSGGNVMLPAIFKTRKIGRERYEDVRRVEISEVKKP